MEPHTLTVMGDSIAVGLGDPVAGHPDLPWADQLARSLGAGPALDLRNLGVVGAKLHDIVAHQLPDAIGPASPTTVLTGGGNDVLDVHVRWGELEDLLDVALRSLRAAGTQVVTFGLFDVTCTDLVPGKAKPMLRERIRRLNELTARVAARHRGCFVDFFDHPQQSPQLFSADGLHPNRRAHELIANEVRRALAQHAPADAHAGVA